jgi:hypothetical protein
MINKQKQEGFLFPSPLRHGLKTHEAAADSEGFC